MPPRISRQMYNFTNFAITLNELESGMEGILPQTDCRLRPDIRAMENGDMGNEVFCFVFLSKFPELMNSILQKKN